jgi:hypothetical protein
VLATARRERAGVGRLRPWARAVPGVLAVLAAVIALAVALHVAGRDTAERRRTRSAGRR